MFPKIFNVVNFLKVNNMFIIYDSLLNKKEISKKYQRNHKGKPNGTPATIDYFFF